VLLSKGANVSLTAVSPGLSAVVVGFGWDARSTSGDRLDLDACALLCSGGQVVSDAHVVFFNNKASPDGAVEHAGDELTGEGDGDDERLRVDLDRVPAAVDTIVFPVTIDDARRRGQSFRQVRHAYVRVLDQAGGAEVVRYDLAGDATVETAMVFAELYRHGQEWKFRAVGQGSARGLRGIAGDLGVDVG